MKRTSTPVPGRGAAALLACAALLGAVTAVRTARAVPPAPPANVEARDHPFDGGAQIDLSFSLSLDDVPLTREQERLNRIAPPEQIVEKRIAYYHIERSAEANGAFEAVAKAEPDEWDYDAGRMTYTVEGCVLGEPYWFRVTAVASGGEESEPVSAGPAAATRQLFDGSRFWMGVITVIICGAVIWWIRHARSGRPIKVRRIAGLEAVDEAVGRATEMGRPCLFVPGIQDMNDIQTIAGVTILARVARTAAEYDAKVEVPTSRALVMTAARETVQSAFLAAGRPDAYNEDLIYYVTDEQFGYVAYLQGMMVREKPAACFYMGSFFAESLILAETGNAIGAIQVAGTAQPSQLPFFVAACDFTLIGEEFFAASAYLSGSPEELGSLKGQDVGKVVVAFGLLVGVVCATIAQLLPGDVDLFQRWTVFITEHVMS